MVESRGGEDLKARAEVWVSAIAGPKTAGGQSYHCADAGGASGSRARERLRASARCQTELATVVAGCLVPRASYMLAELCMCIIRTD